MIVGKFMRNTDSGKIFLMQKCSQIHAGKEWSLL